MRSEKKPKGSKKTIVLIIVVVVVVAVVFVLFYYNIHSARNVARSSGFDTSGLETTKRMADSSKKEIYPELPTTGGDSSRKDTTTTSKDTVKNVVGARFGMLGYHYDPIMPIRQSQEINVYLSPQNLKSLIRDTIQKIIIDEDPNRNVNDTGKIEFKEHIPLYNHVTMRLLPLDSGITILKVPDMTRQEVNLEHGNTWSWSIFAKSAEKEQSTLALVITSEDPNRIEKRLIHIKIHIESNIFRILFNYLIEHPGDFILKIIAPAIAAIWGVIFLKRRKDANENGKDAT
jgi:hypothetical protein